MRFQFDSTLRLFRLVFNGMLLLAALSVPARAQIQAPPNVIAGGVVDNAMWSSGGLTAGSIAAVFGTKLNNGSTVLSSNLGPDGKLVTSLGGASVTINDVPAPIFYSTPNQLGIQIPFELSGQTTGTIQVTVGGQVSVPRTISLNAFAPVFFASGRDASGPPEAIAFHENGVSQVTWESPARRNEVIVIYALGLGSLTPP